MGWMRVSNVQAPAGSPWSWLAEDWNFTANANWLCRGEEFQAWKIQKIRRLHYAMYMLASKSIEAMHSVERDDKCKACTLSARAELSLNQYPIMVDSLLYGEAKHDITNIHAFHFGLQLPFIFHVIEFIFACWGLRSCKWIWPRDSILGSLGQNTKALN